MKRFLTYTILILLGWKGIQFLIPGNHRDAQKASTIAAAAGYPPPQYIPAGTTPAELRRHVVLFTGTEWCPACNQLEEKLLSSRGWKEFVRSEILFTVIDVPQVGGITSQKKAVDAYEITSFPTMMVVDQNGKPKGKLAAVGQSVEFYRDWVRAN